MSTLAAELEPYRAAWKQARRERSTGEPDFARVLREDGLRRFEARGFPTTREEAWRFTSVAPIARTRFGEADSGLRLGAVGPTLQRLGLGGAFKGREAVFVNGRFAPDLSSLALPGVEVRSLSDMLERRPATLEPHLGRIAADPTNPFVALNDAFLQDGACVRVAPGARVDGALHLLFLSTTGGGAPSACHPRVLILMGRDSECAILESYGGPNHEAYLTNAVCEARLDDGARLDHVRLQRESLTGFHVATLAVSLARDSRFASHSIATGAALARLDVDVRLCEPGADCTLLGLFVGDGQQLLDFHTRVEHAQPHGTSRQLYKGILGGRSRGVFHGRVVVRPGAQKTDALQTNKNLLLSREALVHSTPQLEILADDVKCKHGSTTGQLDALQLFYLQSRGLSAEAARSLLTFAFASDVVSRLPVPAVKSALESFLQDRLPSAPKEAVA
jgi:Fe-S cluster assembly protein SufD